MIVRLSIETRAAMFEDCLKQLEEMIAFFYDILTYKLSPFDWRNYEGDWNYRDIDNFSLPYDDKDAPFIGQLYHELQVIYEKLKARNEKVQADADANDLARRRLEVWQYGLCPYAIEECRKDWEKFGTSLYHWQALPEIASYLTGKGMSYAGTIAAVEQWHDDKREQKAAG